MSFLEVNEILRDAAGRISFKEHTQEKDVILLIMESTMVWARVQRIEDLKQGDDRRLIIIKILSIPLLEMHLKLNDNQINGEQPFKIDKRSDVVYMKAVNFEKLAYMADLPVEEVYSKEELKDEDFLESTDNIVIDGNESIN